MLDLIRHLITSLEAGRETLLCQVVETRGSTPQKAGSLLLVDRDAHQRGTLGGGCVEAEVKQKAIRHFDDPTPCLHTHILDHDAAWADGLICGGKMVFLSERPHGPAALTYWRTFLSLLEAGQGLSELVVLDPARAGIAPLGARFLLDPNGQLAAAYPEQPITPTVLAHARPLADRPRPGASQGVAMLPHAPRVRLWIVGAGHVGQAVADLASRVDFEIAVVDDRREFANSQRFPSASTILVGPFQDTLTSLTLDPHDYALIVTRGHGHDEEALQLLAETRAGYVGLIGSKRKIRLIFESLLAQGVSREALARVAAPVGLGIGSESVTEIAVSIVAELIARRNLGAAALAPRHAINESKASSLEPTAP